MPQSWRETLQKLLDGDRAAFLTVSRIVTGSLAGMRAYDFRDEWDDLVQDVIWIVVEKARKREIESPDALPAFVRTTTRFVFHTHLRRAKRLDYSEDLDDQPDTLCWPLEVDGPDVEEVKEQVRRLPERQRRVIEAKYFDGRTQKEASVSTGIPLGSLKRYQAEALATLRLRMAPEDGASAPESTPGEHQRAAEGAAGLSGGVRGSEEVS